MYLLNNKTIADDFISPYYLSLVAEANDYPIAQLYATGPNPDNDVLLYLLSEELFKLKNHPLMSELLNCSAP